MSNDGFAELRKLYQSTRADHNCYGVNGEFVEFYKASRQVWVWKNQFWQPMVSLTVYRIDHSSFWVDIEKILGPTVGFVRSIWKTS